MKKNPIISKFDWELRELESEKYVLEDAIDSSVIYLMEIDGDFYDHDCHDKLIAKFYCSDTAQRVCDMLNSKVKWTLTNKEHEIWEWVWED